MKWTKKIIPGGFSLVVSLQEKIQALNDTSILTLCPKWQQKYGKLLTIPSPRVEWKAIFVQ